MKKFNAEIRTAPATITLSRDPVPIADIVGQRLGRCRVRWSMRSKLRFLMWAARELWARR